MTRWAVRIAGSIALLLPLASCYLAPGQFVSTLDIRQDRHFTFTYVGEVIAPPDSDFLSGKKQEGDSGAGSEQAPHVSDASLLRIATANDGTAATTTKPETPATRARMEALAGTLSREYGFRSVRYTGNAHFSIDYAISGTLTHNFVFPFNIDGEIVIPFIAIELRGRDRVRVKAPGYAADDGQGSAMASATGGLSAPGKGSSSELDGMFTLTTDAEIISQNQEDGSRKLPDGRSSILWTATPRTRDAPLATLKLAPLP